MSPPIHLLALVGLAGCVFDSEVRGSWSIGGADGCAVGTSVMVEAPGQEAQDADNEPIAIDRYGCTDGRFALDIPLGHHAFALELRVEDGASLVGYARLELHDVTDDLDVGQVAFGPPPPAP